MTASPLQKRRKRTVLTAKQHRILRKYFDDCPFPDSAQRSELGKSLEMSSRTVQVWFQNQRQKKRALDRDIRMPMGDFDLYGPLKRLAEAACIEYQKRLKFKKEKAQESILENNSIQIEDKIFIQNKSKRKQFIAQRKNNTK